MRLWLETRVQKCAFAVVCLAAATAYGQWTWREYRAASFADRQETSSLEAAVRLRPQNADYYWRLGRYLHFGHQSIEPAIEQYKTALRLNPYNAHCWLDLASAYVSAGQISEARAAAQEAVQKDATNPDVLWQAANLQLVVDQNDAAMDRVRDLLERDPGYLPQALRLCWRVTADPDRIAERALPPTTAARAAFVSFLASANEPEAAGRAWTNLMALGKPVEPGLMFPYIEYLLQQNRSGEARKAWQQAAELEPQLRNYVAGENAVTNGGFDYPILNRGFDWRHRPAAGVQVSVDARQYHSAPRSLSLRFQGAASGDAGISQILVLDPDRDYEFSAYVKASAVEGVGGPRFRLDDALSPRPLLLTGDVTGTTNWQHVSATFHTGPSTTQVVLKLTREPANTLIRGQVWIDDVSVRPK